jgi:two-component system CheB/CheR fusion protein
MPVVNHQLSVPFVDIVLKNEAGLFIAKEEQIIFCNESFSSIHHLTPDDVANTSLIHYIKKEEKERLKLTIQKLSKSVGSTFSDNFQYSTKSEEHGYMSLHLRSYKGDDGQVYIVGASRNATDRVTKIKQIIETKTLFESLYQNMARGIVIYDYIEEKILECNQLAVDILEYESKENIIGLSRFEFIPEYSDYFPKLNLHKISKSHDIHIENRKSFNIEGVFLKGDGGELRVTGNIVPIDRKPKEAFIIFNDLTEKYKRIEEKRKVEKSYRHIFNNSHEAIIYVELQSFTSILANKNALDLLGVNTLEELSDLDPNKFLVLEEDEKRTPAEYYKDSLQYVLNTGRLNDEVWLASKNNELVRVKATCILDSNEPESPKIIIFLKDITSLFKVQQELQSKNTELEKYIESNLQLEKFAYFASHDLQTPLRSIISFTQLLERNLSESISEKEKGYMDYIIDSAKNMKDLVNDILSFSRVEVDDFEVSEFKIQELWDDIIPNFQTDINDHNIKVELNCFDKSIFADKIKLKQILTNLFSNAIKFRNKIDQPEISICCNEMENEWMFKIRDNGIGIDKEFHSQVFMLFKSLHPRSEYKGTGIGLNLVKKLVEAHNGKVWLESELGEGTTFYFTIGKPDNYSTNS